MSFPEMKGDYIEVVVIENGKQIPKKIRYGKWTAKGSGIFDFFF